ncbi:MAG: hypothetical protein CL398_01735 [Acidiferrobacteraceae bacterium]|nr:hypothetical protein [Acidiferrobacteraceae bacterium]
MLSNRSEVKKFCATDIGAVSRVGIEAVRNCIWPVDGHVYDMIYTSVLDSFIDYVSTADERSADLCMSDTAFFDYLVQTAHYNLLKNIATKRGLSLVTSESSLTLISPEWLEVGVYYDKIFQVQPHVRELQKIYRNFKYNRHRIAACFRCIGIPSNSRWIFGATTLNWLEGKFLEDSKQVHVFRDWNDTYWMPSRSLKSTAYREECQRLKHRVADPLMESIRDRLVNVDLSLDWESIAQAFGDRLSTLSIIYDRVLAAKHAPLEIIATAENDPRRKIFLVALQRMGIKVTGFLHGDPIYGVYKQPYTIAMTMGHIKTYITPSATSADLHNYHYGNGFGDRFNTKFVGYQTDYYSRVSMTSGTYSGKTPNSLEKVMIVGFPMNTIRYYDDHSLFFYHKLLLEISLISALRKIGCFVIYRAHPDRLNHIVKLISPMVDNMSVDSFSKELSMVDTLIFSHPTTSTFGESLLTNKNMILLENRSCSSWDSLGRHYIEKRCHFVDVLEDDYGQPGVNIDQLATALRTNDGAPRKSENTEFVDYYWRDMEPTPLEVS